VEVNHLKNTVIVTGFLTKDINLQVFLLFGLFIWKSDQESAAVANVHMESPMTYSGSLKNTINKLTKEVLERDIFSGYQPIRKYNGITNGGGYRRSVHHLSVHLLNFHFFLISTLEPTEPILI
jgi:hypothetical protein